MTPVASEVPASRRGIRSLSFGTVVALVVALASAFTIAEWAGGADAASAATVNVGTIQAQMANTSGYSGTNGTTKNPSAGDCIRYGSLSNTSNATTAPNTNGNNGTANAQRTDGNTQWVSSGTTAYSAHGNNDCSSINNQGGGGGVALTSQSALGFSPSSVASVQTGALFNLGRMVHRNNPVSVTNSWFRGDMKIQFLDTTLTYQWRLHETTNNANPASNPLNNDLLDFTNQISQQQVVVNGLRYTLVVFGFTSPQSGNNCNATIPSTTNVINSFSTVEQATTYGCLYASLEQVRTLKIVKQVQSASGTISSIPAFGFDASSTLTGSLWGSPFSLTPTAAGAAGAASTERNLAVGQTVNIAERPQTTPWAFTSLTCLDGVGNPIGRVSGQSVTFDGDYSTANVNAVPITCTFVNTYTPRATLTLQKQVVSTGQPGDLASPYNWTLTATPRNLSGQGVVSGRGQTGQANTTPNSAITNQSVIAGTYDLSESPDDSGRTSGYVSGSWSCFLTNNPGQSVAVTGGAVTLTNGQNVTCRITNTFQTGELRITKTVTTTPAGGFTGGTAMDFTARYTCDGGLTDTVTVNASATEGQAGTAVVVPNLPAGANCSVVEIPVPTGSEGLANSSWLWNAPTNPASVTIPAGDAVTVNIGNSASQRAGTLQITKAVAPENDSTPQTGYAGGGNRVFPVAYSCTLAGAVVRDGTVNVTINQPAQITGVPATATCSVTDETLETQTGDFAAEEYDWTGYSVSPTTVDVPANGTATLGVTNRFIRHLVNLTLVKAVTGDGYSGSGDDFTIHYDCGKPEAIGSVDLGDGDRETVQVPARNVCRVTEDTPAEDLLAEGYVWDAPTYEGLTNGTVTIPAGESRTVTVTNHNRIGYGRIAVTKDIAHYGDQVASGTSFTVTVQCDAHAQGETENYQGEFTLSWPNPETPVTPLLPIGTSCDVSETTAPTGSAGLPDGSYAWAGVPATQTVTVPAGGDPAQVTVTNDITRVTGTFQITKTLENNADIDPTEPFTGTWTCTYGSDTPVNGTWSAPAAGGAATLTPSADVLVGSRCTVTEDAPANPSANDSPAYVWAVTVPGPTTVDANGATATVHNVLNHVTGSFSLTKSVAGGEAGTAFADSDFTFSYVCGSISGTLTVKAGQTAAPDENIPVGTMCTLTETGLPDPVNPYQWDGVSFTGGTPVGDNAVTFSILGAEAEIAITATNEISPKQVPVSVSKTISDPDGGLTDTDKTFSVTLICDGAPFATKQITTTTGATWDDVPLGSTCHAVEGQANGDLLDASFAWGEASYDPESVTVSDTTGTYSLVVTNTIVRRHGTIGLQKSFNNNGFNGVVAPDKVYTGTWSCVYGTDDPVTGTWSGVAGQPATLAFDVPGSAILLESACTATEDPLGAPSTTDPSYAWGDAQFTAVDAVSSTAADNVIGVGNSLIRHTGSLDVAKVLTGATAGFTPGDNFAGFTIGVACTLGDDQRLEREVTVPAGGAAQPLIDNVPAGWSCTVTELSPPASVLQDASYAWGGIHYTIDGEDGNTTTVVADQTAHAIVTNTISRVFGSVQITKVISTSDGVPDDATFSGTYTCVYRSGESDEATYTGTWTVTGAGDATLSGDTDIPVTSSCSITENNLDDADLVDGSWTWRDPELSDPATVTSSAQPAALTVTNGADRVWAGLQVEKTYSGEAAALPDGLTVGGSWSCMLGDQLVDSGRWSAPASGGTDTVATPADERIPATATCAVQEDTLDDAVLTDGSFTWDVPTYTPSTGEVTAPANDTASVTVANGTHRVTTAFAVTKNLVAGAHTFDQNLDWMQTFSGQYSCQYGDDEPVTGDWGPVAHDGVITIPDILVGSTCQVTAEQRPDQPVPGAPSFVWLPVDLGQAVVTPNVGEAFPTITVTNTVQRLVGAFTLAKSVTGDTDGLVPGSVFTFSWQCRAQNGDLYPADGPGTIELGDGDVWDSPEAIAAGAECTVTEQTPPDPVDPSYAWSSSLTVTGVAAQPVDSNAASVTFTTEDDVDILVAAVNELTRTMGSYSVSKSADPASGSTVTPGQTITYTLTVTPGDTGFVRDVVVTDDLSDVNPHASLQVDSIDASQGTTSLASGALVWTVGTVRAGDPLTLTYQAIVKPGANGVTIRNAVTADGEIPPTECEDCTTTHVTPAWTLSKSSDPASGSQVDPGDVVTYTLTARNTSSAIVDGATAVDDLSDVLSHASISGDLGDALALSGTTLTWTIPTLQPGDSASVQYRVRVDANAAGVTLRNVVDPVGSGGTCDGCTTTAVVPPIVTPIPPPGPELPVTGGTIAWGVGAAALLLVLAGLALVALRRRHQV